MGIVVEKGTAIPLFIRHPEQFSTPLELTPLTYHYSNSTHLRSISRGGSVRHGG